MRKKMVIVMGVAAMALVVGTSVSGYSQQGSLSDELLARTYGGACETGCESQDTGCNSDAYNNCSTTGSCQKCDSAVQDERCEDWGYCVTWPVNTCSTCRVDPSVACGAKVEATCTNQGGLGNCVGLTHPGGNCGDADQCTTI